MGSGGRFAKEVICEYLREHEEGLEEQTELAAGVILLSIFWPLRIPNTEEHFMQFLELEKGMQGRLFGYMQALLEIRREEGTMTMSMEGTGWSPDIWQQNS